MTPTSPTTSTSNAPLFRVGLLGGGTVGGGVYELLMRDQARTGVVVTTMVVRDASKPRDFVTQSETKDANNAVSLRITTDVQELYTEEVDCVVEVAGGSSGVPKDVVLKTLARGKAVVTANKALLAECLDEIQEAVKSSNKNHKTEKGGASIGYEAAVCGGIPIIDVLQHSYRGDVIQSVSGICNGTTNFMLSHMAADPTVQYSDILQQAQDLGYAEADPTADVEGHDVRAKIIILAKLAFGTTVGISDVRCTGITTILPVDFLLLKKREDSHRSNTSTSTSTSIPPCTIKLVGTAALDTSTLCVRVTPCAVPLVHPLAGIDGSGNCVVVTSQNMGVCSYSGPGAGRYPTANSIVSDVYRAAAGHGNTREAFPAPLSSGASSGATSIGHDYTAAFYVRCVVLDDTHGATISAAAAATGVTVEHSVTHVEEEGDATTTTTTYMAVWTKPCTRSTIDAMIDSLPSAAQAKTLCLPLL